jgi:hypothetical protein
MKDTLYYLEKCYRLLQFTNAPEDEMTPLKSLIDRETAHRARVTAYQRKRLEVARRVMKLFRKPKYRKALRELGIT